MLQNDKKMLTPKALVNEIRSLYKKNKRNAAKKAAEQDSDANQKDRDGKSTAQSAPRALELSFDYHDISIHHQVYTVLSYAVECGPITAEEKVSNACGYVCLLQLSHLMSAIPLHPGNGSRVVVWFHRTLLWSSCQNVPAQEGCHHR